MNSVKWRLGDTDKDKPLYVIVCGPQGKKKCTSSTQLYDMTRAMFEGTSVDCDSPESIKSDLDCTYHPAPCMCNVLTFTTRESVVTLENVWSERVFTLAQLFFTMKTLAGGHNSCIF